MLTRLYKRFDGKCSDLWLRSADGAIFAVHRLIVCTQSDVIKKLLVDAETESHEVTGAANFITHTNHTRRSLI